MIFSVLNPEKICHENLTDLSTSPVRCSYFTLEIEKVIFNQGLKNLRNFEARACIGLQKNLDFINKNVRLD